MEELDILKKDNKRILVVEDDYVSMMVVTKLLYKLNFDVLQAFNGQESIDVYKSECVDLILMDIQMPVMDGISATREIRYLEGESEKHVPIVALTAYALNEDHIRCIEAGMDDYMAKPIDINELINKIFYWLK